MLQLKNLISWSLGIIYNSQVSHAAPLAPPLPLIPSGHYTDMTPSHQGHYQAAGTVIFYPQLVATNWCTPDVFSCNEPLIMIIVSLIMMESANKLVICRQWRAPVLSRECFIGRGELANAEQVLLKCFYKLNDMFMAQRHPWSRHLMAKWWWSFCRARK